MSRSASHGRNLRSWWESRKPAAMRPLPKEPATHSPKGCVQRSLPSRAAQSPRRTRRLSRQARFFRAGEAQRRHRGFREPQRRNRWKAPRSDRRCFWARFRRRLPHLFSRPSPPNPNPAQELRRRSPTRWSRKLTRSAIFRPRSSAAWRSSGAITSGSSPSWQASARLSVKPVIAQPRKRKVSARISTMRRTGPPMERRRIHSERSWRKKPCAIGRRCSRNCRSGMRKSNA